jgi:Divergent InlB B-repeat domain/Abnormal spindle-like microcephaly-assoc'd, ASPM-SPD-2-Hydin/Lactonase, 7-bladed beta-propeller
VCYLLLAISLAVPRAGAQSATPEYLFGSQTVTGPSGSVAVIATYTVDTTSGALTPITAAPVQPRSPGASLAINPAGTMLFQTTTNSASLGAVGVFSIASDGSLTEVPNSPFGVGQPGNSLMLIAVSPNGKFLYLAFEESGVPPSTIVDVFAIAADGSLSLNNEFTLSAVEFCDPPTPAPLTPIQFYIHPTQKSLFLFMGSTFGPPCSGQPSEVQPFTINSDGTLTAGTVVILSTFATSGYALTGSPDGSLLYLMTNPFPLENTIIYGGGIDPTTLNPSFLPAYSYPPASQPPFTPPPVLSPGALAIDSTSTYLYSSAGTFRIQDGGLTLIDSSTNPFLSGGSILASTTAPLIFGSTSTGSFVVARVNSDGSLTQAPGSPYANAGGSVLSQPTPIPDKAVLWVQPDGPITIFNAIAVGQTGSANLSILNMGYGPLTINSIAVTGDPSFSVAETCTSPMAPGGTCPLTVNFTPTTVGTFTGTLTIDTSAATRTLAISGTSEAPPPPAPDPILVAPTPILFPDTAIGSSSPLTVQLQNGPKATASLVVTSIDIGGSNPGDFSQTNTCTAAPIPAGSSCSITLTFSPQAVGGRAGAIVVSGPNGLTLTNTLTGNGATTVTKFTVAVTASGPGTVTQTPTGTSFANNTTITLTATPNANATFVNWGGVCPNNSQTTCTFILNANTTATANFAANVTLTTVIAGPGTIMQSPTGTSFVPGAQVILTAVPSSGAQFVGWAPSSACFPGTPATECIVTLNANTTVTATFTGPQVTLSTNVVGPGTIQQTPSGTSFASGTSITLTAVPNANAIFTSWAGACAGSINTVCTFMLTANTSVTATFTANPVVTVPQTPPPAPAGSTITAPITVTGFAMPPTLKASCTIPQGNCSISGTTLTVTTTARSSGLIPGRFPRVPSLPAPPRGVMIIALAMMSLALLAKNSRAKQFLRPAALVGALLFAGCGGGGNTPPPVTGTPAGNYTVTITATLGAQTAMTSVVITVQ